MRRSLCKPAVSLGLLVSLITVSVIVRYDVKLSSKQSYEENRDEQDVIKQKPLWQRPSVNGELGCREGTIPNISLLDQFRVRKIDVNSNSASMSKSLKLIESGNNPNATADILSKLHSNRKPAPDVRKEIRLLKLKWREKKHDVLNGRPYWFNLKYARSLLHIYNDIEQFDVGELYFSQEYKNPCLWDEDGKLRCVPYMYLVGAPKCGSTDFFSKLALHPQFVKPKQKEPNWIQRRFFKTGTERTIRGYFSVFDHAADAIQNHVIRQGRSLFHPNITGDFSVLYLMQNDYWPLLSENDGRKEPLRTNADFIHQLNPNAKIVVIVRNPIYRLYSAYLVMKQKLGHSPRNFHSFVEQGIPVIHGCMQSHSIRACLYNEELRDNTLIKITVGMYVHHLQEYYRVFPRDHVLVIRLEDYSSDFSGTMTRVLKFLDIQELSKEKLSEIRRAPRKNITKLKAKIGPMLNQTVDALYKFYKPFNEQLAVLLGDGRFNYDIKEWT